MGVEGKQEKYKLREIIGSWEKNVSPAEYELICMGLYIALPVLAVLLILSLWLFTKNHEAFRTLALSLAALIGLPLLIWRGVSLDRSSKAAEKQAENASKSHVADTYTKAIEQLGAVDSKGEPNLELRLGGLYALEKIAKANEDYHPQIMEVLCAYVRMHCPTKHDENESDNSNLDENESKTHIDLLRIDIQACLTVIGRRDELFDKGSFDLCDIEIKKAALSGAYLSGADLIKTDLSEANLSEAYLIKANLRLAYLQAANLSGAILSGANLIRANLLDADLSGAQLINANITKAALCKANLIKATLIEVDFLATDITGADLSEADLRYAKNLKDYQIRSAKIDRKTKLPDYIKVTWGEDGTPAFEQVGDSN